MFSLLRLVKFSLVFCEVFGFTPRFKSGTCYSVYLHFQQMSIPPEPVFFRTPQLPYTLDYGVSNAISSGFSFYSRHKPHLHCLQSTLVHSHCNVQDPCQGSSYIICSHFRYFFFCWDHFLLRRRFFAAFTLSLSADIAVSLMCVLRYLQIFTCSSSDSADSHHPVIIVTFLANSHNFALLCLFSRFIFWSSFCRIMLNWRSRSLLSNTAIASKMPPYCILLVACWDILDGNLSLGLLFSKQHVLWKSRDLIYTPALCLEKW